MSHGSWHPTYTPGVNTILYLLIYLPNQKRRTGQSVRQRHLLVLHVPRLPFRLTTDPELELGNL